MGEIWESCDILHVVCRTCGKPWPSSYGACPDDGTLLSPPAKPNHVHAAETMPLPGRRAPPLPLVAERVGLPANDRTSVDLLPASHTIRGTIDRREESLAPFDNPFLESRATDLDLKVGPNFLVAKAVKAPNVGMPALPPEPVELAQQYDERDADTAIRDRAHHAVPPRAPKPSSSDPPTSIGHRNDHIDLPSGSVVNNEYEIEQRIGAGAMGEVYAAQHQTLGKRVAIKVMSPRISSDIDAVERFEQEARTLAMIHHPGIVDVIGFGQLADTRSYFVMEYLRGESLEERIDRGRVPPDEALDILDQMARALEAAHAQQVVHRDLKPANTFLVRLANESRPIVKLLDFGLAKLAAAADKRAERTQSGVVIGTALYLSPEQCRGPNVDGRTDIYSLGCIAYELLLGSVPFPGATSMASLIAAHMHEAPPLPRSICPAIAPLLDLLLFGMLAKDPAHRPTLAQIRHVLASVRSPTAMPVTRVTAPQRAATLAERTEHVDPTAPRRGVPVFMIALVAAALLGGILIGGVVRGGPSPGSAGSAATDPSDVKVAPAAARDADIAAPELALDAALAVAAPAPVDAIVVPVAVPSPGAGHDAGAVVLMGSGSAVATEGSAAAPPAPRDPATPSVQHPAIGHLDVTSKPLSMVIIDGKPTGRSTPNTFAISSGAHRITFVLGGDKFRYTKRVTITPGETLRLNEDLKDKIPDPFADSPDLNDQRR